MKDSLKVADLLDGCVVGRVQSVGRMQVLPLLESAPAVRTQQPVTAPQMLEVWTSGYGTMRFHNPGPVPAIVPCHLALLTSQAAQDHAMPAATLVAAGAELAYGRAMCVQQSQGGLVRRGVHGLAVLPAALRGSALAVAAETGYNRLWDAVQTFNRAAGVAGGADLVRFMKAFQRELDLFTAEFESVAGQVGAIVLVDGEVVGVERTPSTEYWDGVWEPLLRFCYGAEVVRREAAGVVARPSTRVALDTSGVTGLEGLAAAVRAADDAEQKVVEARAAGTVATSVELTEDESEGGVTVGRAEGGAVQGAFAWDGERVLYASLTATGLTQAA